MPIRAQSCSAWFAHGRGNSLCAYVRTRCLVFKRMRGIIELLSFCTHAHRDLVCPRGYDFGMRRRRSNWHAHTQTKMICICAGHFDMRTHSKVFMRVGRSYFMLICRSFCCGKIVNVRYSQRFSC